MAVCVFVHMVVIMIVVVIITVVVMVDLVTRFEVVFCADALAK